MDEVQIKELVRTTLLNSMDELLKPVITQMQTDIQTFITETNTELEDKLTNQVNSIQEAQSQPPKGKKDNADSVEVSRIAKLEADLQQEKQLREQQEKTAKDLRFNQQVSSLLDSQPNLLARNTVKELITSRFKGAEEKEGKWLDTNGNELGEYINQFVTSDEGKLFTSATHSNGSGTRPSTGRGSDPVSVSLGEMLMDF